MIIVVVEVVDSCFGYQKTNYFEANFTADIKFKIDVKNWDQDYD